MPPLLPLRETRHTCCNSEGFLENPDESGAELSNEARVWKVYVKETDQWDAELIDGWNKSLDVILVFAALFSAISTSFLIESPGMLKQDPNDVSAAALLLISQTLIAIASNSPINATTMSVPDIATSTAFNPPQHAIIVNTLWYTSLSLSVATSFLAMLAKDWCHNFAANRTGPPREQAKRRQHKWLMIERWKMQGLIVVLPSLIHLSLVLFAVGLSIYVWDLHITPAIPVICVVGAAFTFYVWSSITGIILPGFPYATIVSTTVQYAGLDGFLRPLLINTIKFILVVIARLCLGICRVLNHIILSPLIFYDTFFRCRRFWKSWSYYRRTEQRISQVFEGVILTPAINLASQVGEQNMNPDHITSLSLSWLIKYCETPGSVAIALQAIAGASSKIPKEPLKDSQATLLILQKLISEPISPENEKTPNAYARALTFLRLYSESSSNNREQGITGDLDVFLWDLKTKHEKQLVELIQKGNQAFEPHKANRHALSLGNTATLYSIRLLGEEGQDATRAFSEITRLITNNIGLGTLHPTAFQSLLNAAALFISCSTVAPAPIEFAKLCRRSILKLNFDPASSIPQPCPNLMLSVIRVSCALLHDKQSGNQALDLSQFEKRVTALATHIGQIIKDLPSHNANYQTKLLWVGCIELSSNPARYHLEREKAVWIELKNWCHHWFLGFITMLHDPSLLPENGNLLTKEIQEFSQAIESVNDIIKVPNTQDLTPKPLPDAIYALLATFACWVAPSADKSLIPPQLLSSGFPRLSAELVRYLNSGVSPSGPNPRQPLVSLLWGHCYNPQANRFVQHFCRTQMWLLLYLATKSADSQNRADLARTLAWVTNYQPLDSLEYTLGGHIAYDIVADLHLGTYSWRVVECISQARETTIFYENQNDYAEQWLNRLDVPASLRGLSSFCPPESASSSHPAAPPGVRVIDTNAAAWPLLTPSPVSATASAIISTGAPKPPDQSHQLEANVAYMTDSGVANHPSSMASPTPGSTSRIYSSSPGRVVDQDSANLSNFVSPPALSSPISTSEPTAPVTCLVSADPSTSTTAPLLHATQYPPSTSPVSDPGAVQGSAFYPAAPETISHPPSMSMVPHTEHVSSSPSLAPLASSSAPVTSLETSDQVPHTQSPVPVSPTLVPTSDQTPTLVAPETAPGIINGSLTTGSSLTQSLRATPNVCIANMPENEVCTVG